MDLRRFIDESVVIGDPPRRPRGRTWDRSGPGAGWYRQVTDEAVVLPSGRVCGCLLWIAARSAECLGSAEEAVKNLIYRLASSGIAVLGFEDEAVWVEADEHSGAAIDPLVRDALAPFLGELALRHIVTPVSS
jgi:hypothetical protein